MTTNRPRKWADYIGQERLKMRLDVHVSSARSRKEALDHILLVGPPGCGKTTIARLIAGALGRPFYDFVCPVEFNIIENLIETVSDAVVFLDEFHRYPARMQERFLSVLEDYYYQRDDGTRLWVNGLTFILATTEPDMILATIIDRAAIKPEWDDYTRDEMARIVARMARIESLTFTDADLDLLGGATGGVPRNADDLIVAARDLKEKWGRTPTAAEVMDLVRVSPEGITERHRRYLEALERCGGVAGVGLIEAHMRLPHETVLDTERLLLKLGLIRYGRKGRELVAAA